MSGLTKMVGYAILFKPPLVKIMFQGGQVSPFVLVWYMPANNVKAATYETNHTRLYRAFV